MTRNRAWKLRTTRNDPDFGQVLAEEALEMANKLPETTIGGRLRRGVEKGFLVPVREGVFKLVGAAGRGGVERE